MIYDAIKRRDSLIAGQRDAQRVFASAINSQHDNLKNWLRHQIEKNETRLDTIGLIAKAGCDCLAADAAETTGERKAFSAVLSYIENGWIHE